MADIVAYPTSRKRAYRSGRIDRSSPPANVALLPLRTAAAPELVTATPELAIVLALLYALDMRDRAEGRRAHLFVDTLTGIETLGSGIGDRNTARALNSVGALWNRAVREAARSNDTCVAEGHS